MGIYVKTNIYVRQVCDEFLLEKLTFPNELLEISRKAFYIYIFIYWKLCRFLNNMEKRDPVRHETHDNIIRLIRFACWLDKAMDKQSTYNQLLFYVHINYTTVLIRHGCKYTACLFCFYSIQIVLLIFIKI